MRKFFSTLCLILFVSAAAQTQQGRIDSFIKELKVVASDSDKAKILDSLGNLYWPIKPDSTVVFYEQELSLNYKHDQIKAEIRLLNILGSIYREVGSDLKSGEAFQKAVGLSEDSKDSANLVRSLNNYGYVFFMQGDTKKELSVYQRSEKIALLIKDSGLVNFSRMQMGNAYLILGQLDSAEFVFREVANGPKASFFELARLANIKSDRNQMDSALYYFRLSNQKLIEQKNGYEYLAENYYVMTQLFNDNNQKDSAFHYAQKSFEAAEKTFDSSNLIEPSIFLARLFEEKKDYKEAYRYLSLSQKLTQKADSRKKQKDLINLTLKEEHRKQEIEAEKDKYITQIRFYVLIAALGILLLVSFLFYRNSRNKQKANALLTQQKQKIESTLSELRSTQSQLIQSEKMASLGELTAGIAHEIQNPLNFVNNFSEVNKELIAELKTEIKKGNTEEVNSIADDIEANEEKINHHGKRADAIVKGMLQHSQSSTGVKEPTNINTLAEEYLRLSYHGLRAKDKDFTAALKTDFDGSITNINIIPQDIGRVLLNLYNNAFYAVSERRKAEGVGYEPTVSVSTKKTGNQVSISVRDNGNGIPPKVVDKIFQPFFTTKPTGQGTGLGLSLSYDIIKAHVGEIKVETKEGEESEFIIQLPIV